MELDRVAETRFEGKTDTTQPGAYAVRISAEDAKGNRLMTEESGCVVSWTGEYDQRRKDTGALEKLAAESGGTDCETPHGLLTFRDTEARKRTDLTPVLLGMAMLLFLFDVAQRRLDLFRETNEINIKEEKEGSKRKEKKHSRKPAQEAQAPDAADVLWQSMKNKKKM